LADRTQYWGMLTPPQVRRASLWAIAGAGSAFVAAPMLSQQGRVLAPLVEFIGFSVTAWTLTRIGIGAPGWRVGMPGEFDERETLGRHQALSLSYIIVALVIMGLVVAGGIARRTGFVLPQFDHAPMGSGFLLITGLSALPGIILAWRSKRIEQSVEDEF
jgi:hypothetical protein